MKLYIDSQVETQSVPKLLLQVSAREIPNSKVSSQEEDGLNDAKNAYNNIIISASTLRNILPSQLKNTTSQYKVMCVFECSISVKIMHSFQLT